MSDFDSSYNGSDANSDSSSESRGSGIWDSDEAINSLKMERSLKPDESNEDLTRRLLEEAAPAAAQSIINLALNSYNDNTRLNAAKYITDKLLDADSTAAKQKWEDLVGEVVDAAELHANT